MIFHLILLVDLLVHIIVNYIQTLWKHRYMSKLLLQIKSK